MPSYARFHWDAAYSRYTLPARRNPLRRFAACAFPGFPRSDGSGSWRKPNKTCSNWFWVNAYWSRYIRSLTELLCLAVKRNTKIFFSTFNAPPKWGLCLGSVRYIQQPAEMPKHLEFTCPGMSRFAASRLAQIVARKSHVTLVLRGVHRTFRHFAKPED